MISPCERKRKNSTQTIAYFSCLDFSFQPWNMCNNGPIFHTTRTSDSRLMKFAARIVYGIYGTHWNRLDFQHTFCCFWYGKDAQEKTRLKAMLMVNFNRNQIKYAYSESWHWIKTIHWDQGQKIKKKTHKQSNCSRIIREVSETCAGFSSAFVWSLRFHLIVFFFFWTVFAFWRPM